jgi:hypothetical protein
MAPQTHQLRTPPEQLLENFDVFAHDIPPNLRIDGLLGMDFLTRFQAVISVGDAKIRFQ